MNETIIFWICIIVSIIGLLAIAGIVYFGQIILRNQIFKRFDNNPFWEELFFRFAKDYPNRFDDIPRHVVSAYNEYLERRNEFWATYGQVIIAILIIVIISILLLTKVISAEAGLPILSGISGFAIAKGVSGAKSINMPQDRQRG
jgi:uncharacterized membrane protein YhaH (DUF805 family)